MTYRYYKFPNKESVPTNWPTGVSISEIGLIENTEPVYDDRGYEITPATYLDGWHVNVCSQSDINLDFIKEYEITVNTPRRKWFGQ